jgi:uncharacterized protein YbjT (DUF2867 family)
MHMRILITGGTGLVGTQVVRELASGRHDIQVLTRDPSKARNLPEGVTAVAGDLREPATVRRVFEGVGGVFLLNPVGQTEANEALMAVNAMREAGVKRVVYLSVHHVETAPWLPHFGSKIGAEFAVRHSGIPWTILRPNNFFQNDYWVKDALLQYGVYPTPLGRTGVSRVDVRDIAEAAAIALTTSGHDGQVYDVVGPEAMTGESVAQAWSRALGKPIAYGGDDLDAWEAQSLRFMPDWMVYDFRHMWAHFQQHGLIASAEAIAVQTKLLGHAPRPFHVFAAETAAAWRSARSAVVSSPA